MHSFVRVVGSNIEKDVRHRSKLMFIPSLISTMDFEKVSPDADVRREVSKTVQIHVDFLLCIIDC